MTQNLTSQKSIPDPDSGDEELEPLAMIAEEFLAELHAGRNPILSDYAKRIPGREAELRELLSAIGEVDMMVAQDREKGVKELRLDLAGEEFGDFRVLREIGHGGMGIVYEAIQKSLSRRVAIKILNPHYAKSVKQVERFRREAEAAARLHHTNIVPIFGVDQQRGLYYYAMQFIEGITLTQLMRHRIARGKQDKQQVQKYPLISPEPLKSNQGIADHEALPFLTDSLTNQDVDSSIETSPLPSDLSPKEYVRAIARIGLQIAEALDYAHRNGVLHRDIKPSNLILDQQCNVWITDFGLAKIDDSQSLTQSGDILGTIRYMAPEQFRGEADTRSDLFSLGLTLYELLTLRTQTGDSSAILIHQRVTQQSIEKPSRYNGLVSRDLDTILMKAIAPDPFRRYRSAAALAEDLRRYLENRPILARRPSVIESASRWVQANRVLAGLGLLVFTLLVGIVSAEWRSQQRLEEELTKTENAKVRAEVNVALAMNAFDDILQNVTSRGLALDSDQKFSRRELGLGDSQLNAADVTLLEDLLTFYRQFASQSGRDEIVRLRVVEAHERAAQILVRLGRLNEAIEKYRSAIEILDELHNEHADDTKYIVRMAKDYNAVGEIALRQGDFLSTFQSHVRAIESIETERAEIKNEIEVRFERARALELLASIDLRSGSNEGPPPKRPAREERKRNSANRTEENPRRSSSEANMMRPIHPEKLGESIREAANEFRSLAALNHDRTEYQVELANCLRILCSHFVREDRMFARSAFMESLQVVENLRVSRPESLHLQFELCRTLVLAGFVCDRDEGRVHLDRAIYELTDLCDRYPQMRDFDLLLATALLNRAEIAAISDASGSKMDYLRRSERILVELAKQFPDQGLVQLPLADCQVRLAYEHYIAFFESGSKEELAVAEKILLESKGRFLEYAEKASPSSHFNFRRAERLLRSLASVYAAQGKGKEAEQTRREAESAFARSRPRSRDNSSLPPPN